MENVSTGKNKWSTDHDLPLSHFNSHVQINNCNIATHENFMVVFNFVIFCGCSKFHIIKDLNPLIIPLISMVYFACLQIKHLQKPRPSTIVALVNYS